MSRRKRKDRPIQAEDAQQISSPFLGRIAKWLSGAFKAIPVIVTTIVAAYGALYFVFPHLERKEKLGAKIDRLAVQQDIPFGHWRALRAGSMVPPPPDPGDPPYNSPGLLVLVHVQLFGFQSRLYSANVVVLDAKTHREITVEELSQSGGICDEIVPEADDEAFALRCWSPRPRSPRKYLLRVELYDAGLAERYEEEYTGVPDPKLLDFQESEEYTSTGQLPTVRYEKASP
jgi:hypothetical protein